MKSVSLIKYYNVSIHEQRLVIISLIKQLFWNIHETTLIIHWCTNTLMKNTLKWLSNVINIAHELFFVKSISSRVDSDRLFNTT